ncbi:hypothetical protein Plhal304r1_c002g0007481 [Plasmopara halstedii]
MFVKTTSRSLLKKYIVSGEDIRVTYLIPLDSADVTLYIDDDHKYNLAKSSGLLAKLLKSIGLLIIKHYFEISFCP